MLYYKSNRVGNWNLNVPDGWKKYKELSNTIAEQMISIIEDESFDIETVKKKTDALQTKKKFQAFGKTKSPTGKAKKRRLEGGHKSAQGLDDEEEILRVQSQLIEDAINKIKYEKHGRVTNVFKMRELVAGPRKQQQEAHAVKDPKTGTTVVSSEEIKRVNLEHCVNVLRNNVLKEEVKELQKFQSNLHDRMMEDNSDEATTITKDDFDHVVGKFKRKNKKTFYFLTKSGEEIKDRSTNSATE